jgi:cytochrome P450
VFRSKKYFKRATEFIPERWLPLQQRPEEFAHDCLQACQPFSVGPTGCIGRPLAWAEMRLLVARMIWRFEFSMTREKPFSWESLHKMMVVEKRDCWLTMKLRDA